MAEIAPDLVHPVLKKNIQKLLAGCGDLSRVVRWNPDAATHEPAFLNR
jgi:hypothetical protein